MPAAAGCGGQRPFSLTRLYRVFTVETSNAFRIFLSNAYYKANAKMVPKFPSCYYMPLM